MRAAVCLHGDPRIEELGRWWTANRFDMAIRIVIARRTRLCQDATVERIAPAMASDSCSVSRYRTGERIPTRKSLYFIDQFLSQELGELWRKQVDRVLEETGRSQVRAPQRSAEGVF